MALTAYTLTDRRSSNRMYTPRARTANGCTAPRCSQDQNSCA